MAFPFRFGSEFLVNTITVGLQYESTVTALADGRFVAIWSDDSFSSDDPFGTAVRGQIFNADGSFAGNEFLVNSITLGGQSRPSITALADGSFVVTWTDFSGSDGDNAGTAVRARIFDGDGNASGSEFLVNTITAGFQFHSTITALADGRFVVTWTDDSASSVDLSETAVRAQIFNADGSQFGAEFLVNTITTSGQYQPVITALTDGRFVVAWTDFSVSADDPFLHAVRAQIFEADGSVSGAEFLVNTITSDIQYEPSITALTDGRFVVTWTDTSASAGDPSETAVRAQVFNGDGSFSGAEFLVNTITANYQQQPSITALADGRFVVTWADSSASADDPSGRAIRAQVFNVDGSHAGAEFLVNTATNGIQYDPSITALADGRFVVTWTDNSNSPDDPSGFAVRGQIFDPRESAVQLSGTMLDDDFVGTRFGDQIYGFVGNDSLIGASGDDFLFGEMGDDFLRGNAGNDRLNGGDGQDYLGGGIGADQLLGGNGDDTIFGGFGQDYMVGGRGGDLFVVNTIGDMVIEAAGQGIDTVRTKTLDLDLANFANIENLELRGSADLDATGNAKANKLGGNDGNNELNGRGGEDFLRANEGNDKLTGGLGQDTMAGGAGADTFVFNSAAESGLTLATADKILDFSQSDIDLIDLSAIDAGSGSGDQAFSFVGTNAFSSNEGELRYEQVLSNTIISGDIDGDGVADFQIKLAGTYTLIEDDFIL